MPKETRKDNFAQAERVNANLSDESRSFAERIDELRGLVEENLRYTKSLDQLTPKTALADQKELQKLLQENLEISKNLYEMTKKIKHWTSMQRILAVVKIFIIIIPIVLGLIYLPPLLEKVITPYRELLNMGQGVGNIDSQSIIEQITNQMRQQ